MRHYDDGFDAARNRHNMHCQCGDCNDARRRREIAIAAACIPAVRNTAQSIDDFEPRAGLEFSVTGDWSDD